MEQKFPTSCFGTVFHALSAFTWFDLEVLGSFFLFCLFSKSLVRPSPGLGPDSKSGSPAKLFRMVLFPRPGFPMMIVTVKKGNKSLERSFPCTANVCGLIMDKLTQFFVS